MFRTLSAFVCGALISAAVGTAFALTGQTPVNGFGAVDGTWLNGLAGGTNYTYQYGITAHAGGGQSGALVLPALMNMIEVDTVATTGDSVALPYAIQGTNFYLRNAGGATLDIYANPGTNLATGSTDTINGSSNSSAYAVSNNTNAVCFAAKNGVWSCIKGS